MASQPVIRKLLFNGKYKKVIAPCVEDSNSRTPDMNLAGRVGTEGLTQFLHMLGKGLIVPPVKESMCSISPVALNISRPSERFINTGHNLHYYDKFDEHKDKTFAFAGLDAYWGMSPTLDSDLSVFLWGKIRQFGNFIPPGRYGFVAAVPGAKPVCNDFPWWDTTWATDGDTLFKDGQKMVYKQAIAGLKKDLENGVKKFPFKIDGKVFYQTVKTGKDNYL